MNLETYISEFSKYIIALIALLYTVECFLALTLKKEERRRGVYFRQTLLIFAFHFSGFLGSSLRPERSVILFSMHCSRSRSTLWFVFTGTFIRMGAGLSSTICAC